MLTLYLQDGIEWRLLAVHLLTLFDIEFHLLPFSVFSFFC